MSLLRTNLFLCLLLLLVVVVLSQVKRLPAPSTSSSSGKRAKLDPAHYFNKFRNWDVNKKGKIDADLVAPFLGHGGAYESVQPVASKMKTIESDHAPHYSILDYLNPGTPNLPDKIQNVVGERWRLQDELAGTDFPANEARMAVLKKEISGLKADLDSVIRVNKWDAPLKKQYYANNKEINKIEKEMNGIKDKLTTASPSEVPTLELRLADNQEQVNKLLTRNHELREQAEAIIRDPAKRVKLDELEDEFTTLEKINKDLYKPLDDHDTDIKDAMGVLSIPYDKHRIFPSTGNAGLNAEIKGLKTADVATAKVAKEKYDDEWIANMEKGIAGGYIKNADDFASVGPTGNKVYDYQGIWESNFDSIIDAAHGSAKTGPSHQDMKDLHESYAKKFITEAIYCVKTPETGYSDLIELYIKEYKIYLKDDFDAYKAGITKLLEANKEFGWIKTEDIDNILKNQGLDGMDVDPTSPAAIKRANEWNEIEDFIRIKAEKTSNPVILEPLAAGGSTSAAIAAAMSTSICTTSAPTGRKKRDTDFGGCIFSYKRKEEGDVDGDEGNEHKRPDFDDGDDGDNDDMEKVKSVDEDDWKPIDVEDDFDDPKVRTRIYDDDSDGLSSRRLALPSDDDIVSIDSKRLNSFISQLDDDDLDSVRAKGSIVDYVADHRDKLTGTIDDIAETDAIVKWESLDSHAEQNSFARKVVSDDDVDDGAASTKGLSNYDNVKVSSGKFSAKVGKIAAVVGKVGGAYGKIMLAKGFVTALRHGDYESLALMGGKLGLEYGLKGIGKLGGYILKGSSALGFATKLASKMKFLGKIAGPIGDIADIGMNIYSITKHVKILNDPNASRLEKNNAVADIVADSIDIAVTATALALSLAFPPFAPIIAVVAFIINLLTTFIVDFFKAANHVESLNEKLPLLDFEWKQEYWRFVGKRDISGYIQDILDTKAANNIAVNMTVQFLVNNTEYVGRVFPSKTMFNPEAECWLESRTKSLWLHMIPYYSDWEKVSNCLGYGKYCTGGDYKNYKCESSDEVSTVIPVIGHGFTFYRCKCGPDPPPRWGYDVLDNEVNFQYKTYVYLQRASPDFVVPSGFSYLCKPSSYTNHGKRVSNPYTSWEYLCEQAIAVTRSGGKFMLYDLGIGNDRVTLNEGEKIDNLFVVKDGDKVFLGNFGDDTFMLDGPCKNLSGLLDGKGFRDMGNSLVLGENCSHWSLVEVDLPSGKLLFGSGKLLELRNIHRVIGRANATDWITAFCSTKLLVGGGGPSNDKPDVITVPSCSASDKFELTVSVNGSTHLDATQFFHGKVFVLLNGTAAFTSKVASVFGGALIFKFESNAGNLTNASVGNQPAPGITLWFDNGGTCKFEFQHTKSKLGEMCDGSKNLNGHITVLLNQSSTFSRQLNCNLNQQRMQCIFVVNETTSQTKSFHGYDFLDNVFQLISGSWNVIGGSYTDQFILLSSNFSGSIDGGSGHGTLNLTNDCSNLSNLDVDLNSGIIHATQTIGFKGVHALIGRPNFSEHVITTCDTTSLDLGGTASDTVKIPDHPCPSPVNIKITVKGNVTIQDLKLNGTTTIEASLPLQLSTSNRGGGEMPVVLKFPIHKLLIASKQELQIEGESRVKMDGIVSSIHFEEEHDLKTALVVEDNQKFVAFQELMYIDTMADCPKFRNGTNAVSNVFKLIGGMEWTVDGGVLDDTFSYENASFAGYIDGRGGKNSIFIGNAVTGSVSIDTNEVWCQGRKSLAFTNIHEVHGRTGKAEAIVVGCQLIIVKGNGGENIDNMDTVTIPNLDCDSKTTVVAVGFTQLASFGESGTFDIYVQEDGLQNLKFKSDILMTNITNFNIPIKYPSYKLISHQLKIETQSNFKIIWLRMQLSENENFIEIKLKLANDSYPDRMQKTNMMFVDENFNSNGNILINSVSNELNILHVLQESESSSESSVLKTRRGATGAKNIFRLHIGSWEAFGGVFDDSFILNNDSFRGRIHGLGGANSLILADALHAAKVDVHLPLKLITLIEKNSVRIINASSIQIVGGRKMKQDVITCACDTRLVMLEGGHGGKLMDSPDIIVIPESFCQYQISFVLAEYSRVINDATNGNFTYHVRTNVNFHIEYNPLNGTTHNFKFEIPLEQIKYISLAESSLNIKFDNASKTFTLNFLNLPTFQFGQSKELMADLILQEGQTPQSSMHAKSPFSGRICGLNGVENGIVVQTSNSVESIIGGDKDDTIFLVEVNSILLINGMGGTNRLQLSEKLHREKDMEFDLDKGKVSFLEDGSSFVTIVKGIELLTTRDQSFEKVILGCDTMAVKYADDVIIRRNCGYNVRIDVGIGTRVIFAFWEKDASFKDVTDEVDNAEKENKPFSSVLIRDLDNGTDHVTYQTPEDDEVAIEETVELERLEPSTFFYHFSSVQSFDIEIDSFFRLKDTRHIFYLNFTLSDLKTLKFSQNDSRLIYTLWNHTDDLEYSHLVGHIDQFSMFYSHPEFMTSEGFLLRITRYGEIIAVIANLEENLNADVIHQEVIPMFSEYSLRMGISFMLETESDFIYCGKPGEIGVLTNRANKTSHLIGFNETRYEILDLDKNVFIFLQEVQEDSFHVLDLTNIVFQIRSGEDTKYVPIVKQVDSNLEIHMQKYRDKFPGKITLVNGTAYQRNLRIFLNTIAMEFIPTDSQERSKRSVGDDDQITWKIKPVPITIPDGHSYLLAAEDLENGVTIRKSSGIDNSTFEYSKHYNDLVITSIGDQERETGKATTFTIFDYYSDPLTNLVQGFQGKSIQQINNVHVMLRKHAVKISSNEPLTTETGDEISVSYYEDILDREESEITRNFPEMPRKYKVSSWKKITRTTAYLYAIRVLILLFIILVGFLVWMCCRIIFKNCQAWIGNYTRFATMWIRVNVWKLWKRRRFYEENVEDYQEPRLITEIRLTDNM